MKRTLIGILTGLALGAAGTWMLMNRHGPSGGHDGEPKDEAKEHDKATSPTVVKLSRDQQTNAGLQTALPLSVTVKPEIKGYGRVVDPASLLSALFDIETARNALTASSKDHARVKALFGQNQNASLQSLAVNPIRPRDRA